MLNIYPQLKDETYLLRSCDDAFNLIYEKEWLDDPKVIKIINEIDKTKVITNSILESDFLGTFSPEKLSGGCKGLIMMLKSVDYFIYSSAIFGDNCLKYIFDISYDKDIDLYLCSYLFTKDKDNLRIKAKDFGTGKFINSYEDYLSDVLDVASRWWGNDNN